MVSGNEIPKCRLVDPQWSDEEELGATRELRRRGRPRLRLDVGAARRIKEREGLSYRQLSGKVLAWNGRRFVHPSPTFLWRALTGHDRGEGVSKSAGDE